MATAIAMVHEEDPKGAIWKDIEPYLAEVDVLGARVLVAVYVRPKQSAGGIYLPDKTVDEDKYQGKVGLVLALGPIAFEDDTTHRFGTIKPEVGDWIVFSVGDTFGLEIGKRRCRSVEDVDVHMIIDRPDIIL
jgi:co-chaperonin GroES (HSP10)